MNSKEQAQDLKSLGSGKTEYRDDKPSKELLEFFLNSHAGRYYATTFASDEFTSKCPKTGQPDYASYVIRYVPDKRCVESKSLKLYLGSYRNAGAFMERITNDILDDLVELLKPRAMLVQMNFGARGGIGTIVKARSFAPDVNIDSYEYEELFFLIEDM